MKSLLTACFVILLPVMTIASSVTLEPVWDGGFWDGGGTLKIVPTCPVSFNVRVINDNGVNAGGITNGFRVYGPSSFEPPTIDIIDPNFSTSGYFDLVVGISYFSADGIGADTIGFGGSRLNSSGLPDGYNDIAYTITTGGVTEGETLCIDSSFFPPTGLWLWAPGGPPDWGGPYCYLSETCCTKFYIFNAPDTLSAYSCDTIQYNFDATHWQFYEDDTTMDYADSYEIMDGPGTIDNEGNWFFIAGVDDINIIDTLVVVPEYPCWGYSTQIILNFLDSGKPGDINQTCTVDVGDVVFLVDFMFGDGEPPMVMSDADVDGNGIVDIADLVYFVAYQFGGGPPPVR